MADTLSPSESVALVAVVQSRVHGNGAEYTNRMRDELIVRLMLDYGVRAQEIADMVAASCSGHVVEAGGRTLRLEGPAATLLVEVASSCTDPRGRLFPISSQAVRQLVRRYARAAGIRRRINASTLRRTFANAVFPARVKSLRELARMLGVSRTETAARYLDNDLIGAA